MVGCVLTSCHGQNIARQISINAGKWYIILKIIGFSTSVEIQFLEVLFRTKLNLGIPVTSPSVTINKVCSSSMKAIIMATQAVHLGDRDVVLAAGTESMSNAYYGVPRSDNNDMRNPFVVRFWNSNLKR